MPEAITVAEFARRRGLDAQAVRAVVEAGGALPFGADDGLFSPPAAAPQPAAPSVPEAARQEGAAAVSEMTSRARIAAAQAEEAEIRAARAAGRALDRERAERAAFDAFRELRDAAFAAVKSQARKVQGLTEVREIELALEDELRQAFAGWETRMQARLTEAAAA